MADIDLTCINTIRTLAMDAVQKANSGHPGADGARTRRIHAVEQHLNYDPAQPHWANRDRFVL
ncbi:MAG: hypothetical protein U0791_18280 [Gemmataceae bacterium]